jgi:DNA-directed RNA polymerase specialized sigma24 family protein
LISMDQKVSVTSYLVFYLRTIECWSIPEVADLFQLSHEQTRARLHRVKQKFGSILKTKGRGRGHARPG